MYSYAEKFMWEAIQEAQKASNTNEVPIGCVIVKNNQIIANEYDTMETDKTVLSHAEIKAIHSASKIVNDWRLVDCDLFVTVEPCIMCIGAVILSRIRSIYYGVQNAKTGAFSSPFSISNQTLKVQVFQGILSGKIKEQLALFFQNKR